MLATGRLWILVGAIVSAAVIAIGWFLLAAPQLDQAAAADESRAAVEAQNETERGVLAEMKRQYENLDELQAELARLQISVPGTRDLEGFFGEIANAANAAGVVLNGVTVEAALPYAAAVAEGGGEAPVAEDAAAEGAEAETAGTGVVSGQQSSLAAPTLPSVELQSNLYVLPISLNITADADQASAFLALLQGAEGRLVLVDGVTLTIGTSLTGQLTGYIFVVHDPSTGPVGALPEPEETPEPETTATPEPGETGDATPAPTGSPTPRP